MVEMVLDWRNQWKQSKTFWMRNTYLNTCVCKCTDTPGLLYTVNLSITTCGRQGMRLHGIYLIQLARSGKLWTPFLSDSCPSLCSLMGGFLALFSPPPCSWYFWDVVLLRQRLSLYENNCSAVMLWVEFCRWQRWGLLPPYSQQWHGCVTLYSLTSVPMRCCVMSCRPCCWVD